MASDWVKPGQEVALIGEGYGRRTIFGKKVIAKVYANGNFVLFAKDGTTSKQQWRPFGGDARRAGDHYGRDRLEPWSPEIQAEYKHQTTQRKLRGRIDEIIVDLQDMRRNGGNIDSQVIEDIEKVLHGKLP